MGQKILLLVYLLLAFLHGVFASGFVPILNKVMGTAAPVAFALYFAGILAGQLAIWYFAALSRSRRQYPLYEIAFGLSLLLMGLFPTAIGLASGRLLEGLAAGLATPLLFACVAETGGWGSLGKRLALFNSLFALGFVAGPGAVAFLMGEMPYQYCLFIFAGLFFLIPLGLLARPAGPAPASDGDLSLRTLLTQGDAFTKFSTLFLAKCVYGFLLAYITGFGPALFAPLSLTAVMLILSAIFVVGQILADRLVSVFPKEHLEGYVPLALGAVLLAHFFSGQPHFIFAAALLHSCLAFIGYLNFGLQAHSARQFALFSSLSDPALVVGAALAGWGSAGIWGLVALLPWPLLQFLRRDSRQIQAERLFPFVGPMWMYQIFRKHAAPVRSRCPHHVQAPLSLETWERRPAAPEKTLKLLFGGDWCPSPPDLFCISPELRAFILSHDLRLINLEGSLTTASYAEQRYGFLHDIPEPQFAAIQYANGQREPLFNTFSVVNNHALDLGRAAHRQTLARLERDGLAPITSDLQIQSIAGTRVGLAALTFGSNLFWRKDAHFATLKPEQLLADRGRQEQWLERLRRWRAQVDLLILSWHWGYESEHWPAAVQQECFELLRQAGVQILYGHHAHIPQPFAVAAGGQALCLYCCGNFLSDMPQAVYQQGVFFSVEMGQEGGSWYVNRVEPRFFAPRDHQLELIPAAAAEAWRNWQESAA